MYSSKEKLLKYLNIHVDANYSMAFLNDLIDIIGKEWIESVLLKEKTVKYLFDFDGKRDKNDVEAIDYCVISNLEELEKIL